jgi:hypothetical protein
VRCVKRCSTCQQTKPLDAFNRRRASADGHQARCRECSRSWYLENREQHMRNVWRRIRRRRAENRLWLAEYLRDNPCADCGEADIRCLEFDHRPEERKRQDIAALVYAPASLEDLRAEIAKCDVVCANCHRRRTSQRANFWKEPFHRETEIAQKHRASRRLAGLLQPDVP